MIKNSKPRKRISTAVALVLVLLFSSRALANAGTPLMWLPIFRLLFLNIIIGTGEGLLLGFVFRTWKDGKIASGIFRAIGIMILANYFSMLAGEAGILSFFEQAKDKMLGETPLYNAPRFIWMMAIAAFVVTLVLEWPFCFWALRHKNIRFVKSLAACPLVHIFSYAFLALLYFAVSGFTVYTKTEFDKTLSFAKNPQAWIYYISEEDGDVYRIRTNGSSKEKVLDSDIKISNVTYWYEKALFVWPSKEEGYWDLYLLTLRRHNSKLLLERFSQSAAKSESRFTEDAADPNDFAARHMLANSCTDLRGSDKQGWKVTTGFWALEGLYAENEKSGEKVRISMETPFLSWFSCEPTILPGDQVVYELGGQIVLLDLNSRKMGLITLGRGPIVTLD